MNYLERINKLFSRNLSTKGIPKAVRDRVRDIYKNPNLPQEDIPLLEIELGRLLKLLTPEDQALIEKYGSIYADEFTGDFDFVNRRTNKLFGDLTKDNYVAPILVDESSMITVASGLHRIALAKTCGLQTIKVLMVVTRL